MKTRVLVLLAALVLLLGGIASSDAWARGGGHFGGGGHFRGGFHHGRCCWWGPGAFIGGLALGAALAYPYYAYPYPVYAPPVYVPPPVVEAPPVVYQQQQPAALVQREVVYPHGKYVLHGDGVSRPWQWVWVPAPPAPPPPPSPR